MALVCNKLLTLDDIQINVYAFAICTWLQCCCCTRYCSAVTEVTVTEAAVTETAVTRDHHLQPVSTLQCLLDAVLLLLWDLDLCSTLLLVLLLQNLCVHV
jgi:hypothetical protein